MTDASNELANLKDRIVRLEDKVFPPGGGGPISVAQLNQLGQELVDLRTSSSKQIQDLDKKIEKLIDIIARLKEVVEQQGRGGTRQAGM